MRRIVLLGALLLAAGCVTAPPRPAGPPLDAAARRSLLLSVPSFQLEGRLAAAVGQDGFNANLAWSQRGGRSELDLRAPLGFGTAHVVREGGSIRLETSRGERFNGPEADEDLAGRLGFQPPLDSLRYWVLGVADPAKSANEAMGEGGLPASLEQDGWHVEFTEYRELAREGAALWLPRRLTLVREAIRLRLVIDRWTLGAR